MQSDKDKTSCQEEASEPCAERTLVAKILSCTTMLADLFAKQVELENSGQLVKKKYFDSEQISDQKMKAQNESK